MSIRPAGVINNYTVIEAVGRTLAELLMTEMENPVPVTIASPGEDYGVPVGDNGLELGTSRINLFLYRVEEPPHSMNNDWVDAGEGRHTIFPLNLNLHYMLNIFTPDRTSNLDEHRILGDVMQVFHANQIIDPIYFEGTINPNELPVGIPWEELKIIRNPLSLEDLASVWHAINQPYRLSVAYEISVVMIEPPQHKSRRVRRVDVTYVEAIPFRGRPSIRNITPDRGYAGGLITINGEKFDSSFLKLYFNDYLITPVSTSMSQITFQIPEGLPPGLYSLNVSNEWGNSREISFEEISPFLYRLDPEMKYTEDLDYPKNSDDDPVLTIWGGNFHTESPVIVEIVATENGTATASVIDSEQITNNSIKWVIPDDMRTGSRMLQIRLGGARISNALTFEIPVPQIYRVDPDIVSDLSGELIIIGDYFRSGVTNGDDNTELFLHSGELANNSELQADEIISITFVSESEIRTKLPSDLDNGSYLFIVRVYGEYYSRPFTITVNTQV